MGDPYNEVGTVIINYLQIFLRTFIYPSQPFLYNKGVVHIGKGRSTV